jgi:Zn-dependent protease
VIYQLASPSALLGIVLALVLGLLAHDAVQKYAARVLGDRTAGHPRRSAPGRMTALGRVGHQISPHLDVFGAVAAVIAGYGWGAPVPMDERWRNRRWRTFTALLLGPVTYVVLAIAVLLLYKADDQHPGFVLTLLYYASTTLCGQAVLSILPIWPLDGGRALLVVAPQTYGWQRARQQLVENNIGVAVSLLIVLLPILIGGRGGHADLVGTWGFHLANRLAQLVGVGG